MNQDHFLTLLATRLEFILRRASINDDDKLWTSRDIAVYLRRTPKQVVQRYAALPDFPRAIHLPSGETGSKGGKRRGGGLWNASQVIAWAEKYRDQKPTA